MKKTGLTLAVLMLAAGIGCNQSTPGGGGTHTTNGTTTNDQKSGFHLGPKEGEFELTAPDSLVGNLSVKATTIKQGEQLKKDIGIRRGKGFDADVQISFEGMPEGVSVKPANPVLKHGEEKVPITLVADEKAALTKATTKIVGKASKGDKIANTSWTVEVKAK